MKKSTILICLISLHLFLSCSSDNSDESFAGPKSCIELSKDTIEVGEEITIKSCSSNFKSLEYTYSVNNGFDTTRITDPSFTTSFSKPGNYTITLTVINETGTSNSKTATITVNDIIQNYIYIDTPQAVGSLPLGAGIDENSGNLFFIDRFGNILGKKRYYYKEYDSSFNFVSSTLLREETEGAANANRSLLDNGDMLITTVHVLNSSYFSREIKISGNNTAPTVNRTNISVINGNLPFNTNRIFYGSNKEYVDIEQRWKNYPAIEIRDGNNTTLETKEFKSLEFSNSIIGDMIKTSNGYLGFGGAFDIDGSSFTNYTPVLYFFNQNLELIARKSYENSTLRTSTSLSYRSLDSQFNVEELDSGNIVMYGLGEMRVVNKDGDEILSEIMSDTIFYTQGLIDLGDSFVLSTRGYLKKYDDQGSFIKKVHFKGDITPNLLLKDNQILLISGYQTSDSIDGQNYSLYRMFIGAVTKNLNFINLNN